MSSNDDFEDLIASSNKTVRNSSCKKSDSIGSVFASIGQTIPFKALIFIFIVYILINSDYFLQNILFKMSKCSTTDGVNVVAAGVILQALIMAVLSGIFLSLDSMNLV
jgi:hypothetical protein